MSVKVLRLLLVVVLLLAVCLPTKSYAIGDIFRQGNDFVRKANDVNDTISVEHLVKTSNNVYNILLTIAIVVAVVVAMVLGIKFMLGGADEKAQIKEALMPFIVGCIVVFGSFTIWKIVVTIGNSTVGGEEGQKHEAPISPPEGGITINEKGDQSLNEENTPLDPRPYHIRVIEEKMGHELVPRSWYK